jgi:lipopolysaccharide biosynthesis protein
MEIRYSVKDANKAYAERDYKLAIEIYSECVKRNPDLREALKLNIKMCAQKLGIDIATISDSKADLSKKNYSKSNYSNSNVEKKINEIKSVLQSRIQKSKSKSIFILHVYHLELAEELLRRAFYTGKGKIDTVVTCRPEIVDDVKSLLVKFEEDIMVFPLDNIGYDVLPFLIVLKAASAVGYKYFCKAHTKGDNKNESVRSAWRESLLDGVFPKSISYNHITEIFEKDVHVNAMGSYINYISYRNSKYDNHQIVRNAVKLFGLQVNENDDWGFFAGTMFWGRVSTFSKFDVLRVPEAHLKNDINSRSGEHSGFYHSIERIFGLYICGPKSKVALVDYKINKDNCKEVLRVESASAFLKGKAILRYKAYSERKQYARKKLILKSGVVDLFWCYRIYKDQKE